MQKRLRLQRRRDRKLLMQVWHVYLMHTSISNQSISYTPQGLPPLSHTHLNLIRLTAFVLGGFEDRAIVSCSSARGGLVYQSVSLSVYQSSRSVYQSISPVALV